jgi:hypothetical protein
MTSEEFLKYLYDHPEGVSGEKIDQDLFNVKPGKSSQHFAFCAKQNRNRTIQRLRKRGWNINFNNNFYKLEMSNGNFISEK